MAAKDGDDNMFIRTFKWFGKFSKSSPNVFWTLLVVSVAGPILSLNDADGSKTSNFSATHPLLYICLLAIGLILLVIIYGMVGYSASKLQKNEKFSFQEVFDTATKNFGRVFMVMLIIALRLLGWFLLLIIPGIVMLVRYLLSGVIIFTEPDLSPGKVVSRSAELTKNNWWKTFIGSSLPDFVTLGLLSLPIQAAAQAQLYKRFK